MPLSSQLMTTDASPVNLKDPQYAEFVATRSCGIGKDRSACFSSADRKTDKSGEISEFWDVPWECREGVPHPAFFSAREIAMKGTMKSRMRIRTISKMPDLALKFRMNRMETSQ